MSTATIHVSRSTSDLLQELARQLGKSVQAVLQEAVEAYRQRSLPEPGAPAQPTVPAHEVPLVADPNFLAFRALDHDFVALYEGQFAGFCGGRLVALAPHKRELIEILAREHPDDPCLVQELRVGGLRIARFRRPRRMTRISHDAAAAPPSAQK